MNFAQNVTMRRDPQGDPASKSGPRANVGDHLMNSVAGKVELVGLTVARGPQPHSIVTHNIVKYKGVL